MQRMASLACVLLFGSVALAQTTPRIVLDPWQPGPHWAETIDDVWYVPGGDLLDRDTEIDQLWWDSSGRVKVDREDPDPLLAFGYRILTSTFDAPGSDLPTGLTTIALAGAYDFGPVGGGDWSLQVAAGAGTANDNHFTNHHAYYGIGAVNFHRPVGAHGSVDVGVDYDGGRALFPDVPLPYASYTLRPPGETLDLTVGLPASRARWRPWERLTLEAGWEFPLTADARVELRVVRGVYVFGDYHHVVEAGVP